LGPDAGRAYGHGREPLHDRAKPTSGNLARFDLGVHRHRPTANDASRLRLGYLPVGAADGVVAQAENELLAESKEDRRSIVPVFGRSRGR